MPFKKVSTKLLRTSALDSKSITYLRMICLYTFAGEAVLPAERQAEDDKTCRPVPIHSQSGVGLLASFLPLIAMF